MLLKGTVDIITYFQVGSNHTDILTDSSMASAGLPPKANSTETELMDGRNEQ